MMFGAILFLFTMVVVLAGWLTCVLEDRNFWYEEYLKAQKRESKAVEEYWKEKIR